MSARFAKIRKFLLRTLLVLLLLVGGAAILLRSTAVQTYLAHKGAAWLSKVIDSRFADFKFASQRPFGGLWQFSFLNQVLSLILQLLQLQNLTERYY